MQFEKRYGKAPKGSLDHLALNRSLENTLNAVSFFEELEPDHPLKERMEQLLDTRLSPSEEREDYQIVEKFLQREAEALREPFRHPVRVLGIVLRGIKPVELLFDHREAIDTDWLIEHSVARLEFSCLEIIIKDAKRLRTAEEIDEDLHRAIGEYTQGYDEIFMSAGPIYVPTPFGESHVHKEMEKRLPGYIASAVEYEAGL